MTDDEQEDYNCGYVFLVGQSPRGCYVDSMLDVSSALLTKTPEAHNDWVRAMKAMGGQQVATANELAAAISTMRMRARMTDILGPYYVRTAEPLEREQLQEVLIAHEKHGTLENFLRACRF